MGVTAQGLVAMNFLAFLLRYGIVYIRNTLGISLFLGSCTEKHGEYQIIALSSLVLTQDIVLLLGSFATDLIASRTAFLCHSFCCVYLLLPFHC